MAASLNIIHFSTHSFTISIIPTSACIKNLNMPTLITQDDLRQSFLLNPNMTMAIPAFATLPVAQIPKKKFKQLTTRNEVTPPSLKLKKHPSSGP
jgi:hypothetical protein